MTAASVQAAALAALQHLINGALVYDPATLHAFAELKGKIIAVHCTFPPLGFTIEFDANGIRLVQDLQQGAAHTTLTGTALTLASLAINPNRTSLYDSGVSISGDQALLQKLNTVLRNLDIDWEAALAKLLGDVPAHLIGQTLRAAGQWQRTASARMADAAVEFTVEEARLLPSRPEFEAFSEQVLQLRRDVDRLAVRIAKLLPQAKQRPDPA